MQTTVVVALGTLLVFAIGAWLVYCGVTDKVLITRSVADALPINTVLLVVGLVVRVGCMFGGVLAGVHAEGALSRAIQSSTSGTTLRQLGGLSGISTEQPMEAVRMVNLTYWPIILVVWAWTSSIVSKYSFVQSVSFVQKDFDSVTGYGARVCGEPWGTSGGSCNWSPAMGISNTTASLAQAIRPLGYPPDEAFNASLLVSPAVGTDGDGNFYVLPLPDVIFGDLAPGLTSLMVYDVPLIQMSTKCYSMSTIPTFESGYGSCTQGDGMKFCGWGDATTWFSLTVLVYNTTSQTFNGTACSCHSMQGTGNALWQGGAGSWSIVVDNVALTQNQSFYYVSELQPRSGYWLNDVAQSTNLFHTSGIYNADASRVGAIAAMIAANSGSYFGNGALSDDDGNSEDSPKYKGVGWIEYRVVVAQRWGALLTGALFIVLGLIGCVGVVQSTRPRLSLSAEQLFGAAAASTPLLLALRGNGIEGEEYSGKVWMAPTSTGAELQPIA